MCLIQYTYKKKYQIEYHTKLLFNRNFD